MKRTMNHLPILILIAALTLLLTSQVSASPDVVPCVTLTPSANPVYPSAMVTFTVEVEPCMNPGMSQIVYLGSSQYGNLNGQGTCQTGWSMPYSCQFDGRVFNSGLVDVTATVKLAGGSLDKEYDHVYMLVYSGGGSW